MIAAGPGTVRVSVDVDRCCGSGQCALAVPGVFDQREEDGQVVLLQPRPPLVLLEDLRHARDRCPSDAIDLDPPD